MLRAGHIVIVSALALLVLGVVMVNSAGMEIGKAAITLEGVLLSKSTIYMAVALLTMGVVAWLTPVRLIASPPALLTPNLPPAAKSAAPFWQFKLWLQSWQWGGWKLSAMWLMVVAVIALLATVYLPGIGDARKGSHRWVQLPIRDLTLQPSEFAKWFLVALVAWYSVVMGARIRSLFTGLLPILVAVSMVAAFVAIEDLGTAVLLMCVAVVTILAAGARPWHFLLPMPFVAAAGYLMVKLAPYRMARITAFMDPYADSRGTGFHMIQSQVAISSGEMWGRGLGNGLQKFGYLPEDTTDFIFAIICEELGLMGAVVVVVLFCTLVLAGLAIVLKQRTLQAKILALGITATVGIQAVINLFVVVGWGPTKGIALPLLSSGGTGWILTAGALGVLVALDRHASKEAVAAAPLEQPANAHPARPPDQLIAPLASKVMPPKPAAAN